LHWLTVLHLYFIVSFCLKSPLAIVSLEYFFDPKCQFPCPLFNFPPHKDPEYLLNLLKLKSLMIIGKAYQIHYKEILWTAVSADSRIVWLNKSIHSWPCTSLHFKSYHYNSRQRYAELRRLWNKNSLSLLVLVK